MAWEFRYELIQQPDAKDDGSGDVIHQIVAQGSEDEGDWVSVPGRNTGVPVPADDLVVVMAMPHSPGTERQAKNRAYKDLLRNNLERTSVPLRGWSAAVMEELMENNQVAVQAAADADDYITNVLNREYGSSASPVVFTL